MTGIPIVISQNRKDITASLDRIDSSKGYTIDNLQWIHKVVNIMKRNMSEAELVEWCKKVVIYADQKKS